VEGYGVPTRPNSYWYENIIAFFESEQAQRYVVERTLCVYIGAQNSGSCVSLCHHVASGVGDVSEMQPERGSVAWQQQVIILSPPCMRSPRKNMKFIFPGIDEEDKIKIVTLKVK
jgi:hypothetical protein